MQGAPRLQAPSRRQRGAADGEGVVVSRQAPWAPPEGVGCQLHPDQGGVWTWDTYCFFLKLLLSCKGRTANEPLACHEEDRS